MKGYWQRGGQAGCTWGHGRTTEWGVHLGAHHRINFPRFGSENSLKALIDGMNAPRTEACCLCAARGGQMLRLSFKGEGGYLCTNCAAHHGDFLREQGADLAKI